MNDFKYILENNLSIKAINGIVERVTQSPSLFNELFSLTKENNRKIAWRALWACEKLSILMPSLYKDKYDELENDLFGTTHDGMKRLYLNIILHLNIPGNVDVPLLNFCLDNMLSLKEKSSSQAVCMKIAFNICSKEKELLKELETYLENMETSFYKAAAISSRITILRKIKKINKTTYKDENTFH